jgi:hypothetical protein
MNEKEETGDREAPYLLRVLMSLISAVVCAKGALAIATQHHYGIAKNGHEVILDGPQAIYMGIFTVLLGLSLLGVWFNKKHHVAIWISGCLSLASLSIIIMFRAT